MTNEKILTRREICDKIGQAGVNSYNITFLDIDLSLNPIYAQRIGRALAGETDANAQRNQQTDNQMVTMLIKTPLTQESIDTIRDFCATSQGVGYQARLAKALMNI